VTVAHLLERPPGARWLYVLAHGAGAGMRHPFMAGVAAALAARSIATLRWELSYMTAGRRRPDPAATAVAEVREACALARALAPDLRLVAGGKSFGGRMTSTAIAETSEPGLEGLVFLGFPLHPPKKPGITRADHLAAVKPPMLFVQGDRDELAEMALLRPVVAALPRATLHVIEGADHGFAVSKRSGRDSIAEITDAVTSWLARLT
jgi:predicted alpha/beta-hydrolase family hydrolase